MKPFLSQWSLKLQIFTSIFPTCGFYLAGFKLPREGTLEAALIYFGGSICISYFAFGCTLFIRELRYQSRFNRLRKENVPGHEIFHKGYKLVNKHETKNQIVQSTLQILLTLGYKSKEAKCLLEKALIEKEFTNEQDLINYVLKGKK